MYDFKFADIGEGIHEGVILKWMFKVGDKVKEGETLVVVETDKVNAELPSPVDGIIVKLGRAEGETIHVGETVVLIDDGSKAEVKEDNKEKATEEPKNEKVEEAAPGVIGEIEVSSDIIASSQEINKEELSSKRRKALATPVARKLARDLNIDINEVNGTGENGRVLKEDINNFANRLKGSFVSTPSVKVSTEGNVELVPITKLRKAIVKSMTLSKQIVPHTVLMDEVVVDDLVLFRSQAKKTLEEQGIKLTYMAFIMKAVVLALKKYPIFNASFDQENEQMVLKKFYNIGMAVDTSDGLIVPNIKDANQLTILELAKEIKEIGDQTKARKIQLSQLQNTTFTITNFGAAGVAYGTPIINHPEVAIFGIGMITKKPVVLNDEIRISHVLPLSIAVDHRVIDGADAGRFLTYFKELISNPALLVLS